MTEQKLSNRHDNYQYREYDYRLESVNGDRSWNREHHELHVHLVPFAKWEETKNKVIVKIKELLDKRIARSKQLADEILNSDKIKDNDLFWSLVWDIEAEDQLFRQYAVGQKALEHYIEENDYYEGRKQRFPYDLEGRIKCVTCGHSFYNHGGNWNEKDCHGAGDTMCKCEVKGKLVDCQKMVLKKEDDEMLRKLSETMPYETGLDGKKILSEKLQKLLDKGSTGSSPTIGLIYDGICYTYEQAEHMRNPHPEPEPILCDECYKKIPDGEPTFKPSYDCGWGDVMCEKCHKENEADIEETKPKKHVKTIKAKKPEIVESTAEFWQPDSLSEPELSEPEVVFEQDQYAEPSEAEGGQEPQKTNTDDCSMCFKPIDRTKMGGDTCGNCSSDDKHKIYCKRCEREIGGSMYGFCKKCESEVKKENEVREMTEQKQTLDCYC